MKFTSSGASQPKGASGGQCTVSGWSPGPGWTLRTTPTLMPSTAATITLESSSTHPDFCPGDPSVEPNGTISATANTPSAPERMDPLCQLSADVEDDLRTPQGAKTPDNEPLLGAWALPTTEGLERGEEQTEGEECPICTEPYGPGEHNLALLNCGHSLCAACLQQLMGMTPSADVGRVRCPLCRQKTPMLEWEICQLQEELLQADGPQHLPHPTPSMPPHPGPGPWGFLEHRYQLRFLAGPVGGRGCLPFLPCPPSLSTWLWALRQRGPCARRLALLSLLVLELLGLLLIFMPLVLLGVLFMLLERSGR